MAGEGYLEEARDVVGVAEDCPFDLRLARTPYLVLPKLAIQSMPMAWRKRLEVLLREADDAGLATPRYLVLRDASHGDPDGCVIQHPETRFIKFIRRADDPWADYRRGNIREICPTFTGGADQPASAPAGGMGQQRP